MISATNELSTESLEQIIANAEKEVSEGQVSGPFSTLVEMFEYLENLR